MLHVLLPLVAAHPLCGDHWHCAPQQIVDRLHIAADRNESGSNAWLQFHHHCESLLVVAGSSAGRIKGCYISGITMRQVEARVLE